MFTYNYWLAETEAYMRHIWGDMTYYCMACHH